MRAWLSLFVLAALLGCQGCQHPSPAPVAPTAGLDGPATCLDVCRRGEQLGCPWAAPTPAGATCLTVCLGYQQGPAPWDLDCRVKQTTCAAIERCP